MCELRRRETGVRSHNELSCVPKQSCDQGMATGWLGRRVRGWFCRLGLWLVDRCCAPAAPFSGTRSSAPQPSEGARRRMLRRIAKGLAERGLK